MLIILLLVVVLALAGAAGYFQGAVRSLVALVGVFLGALLAFPLGAYLDPLLPKVGLVHPLWPWFVPPLVVFLLFLAVFTAIAFLVHRQIVQYFKYKTDEYQLVSWERLNQRLGVCVGLFTGVIYSTLLGVAIYVVGYVTTQITAGENDPALLRFVSQSRKDLQSTGMDKLVARFDPMKDDYYQAADTLALLHHNPLLEGRLADYPFFLSLLDRPELKDLAEDQEFQKMREQQPTLGEIINHPKVTAILGNQDLVGTLRQVDLKDLLAYLRTGKSAKYDEEKILGRWRLDPAPTMRELRRLSPEMTSAEFSMAKKGVYMIAPLVSVVSSPDNRFQLRLNMAELAQQVMTLMASAAPTTVVPPGQVLVQAAPPPVEAAPAMDPTLAARYGIKRGGTTPPQAQPAAPVIIQQAAPRPTSPTMPRIGNLPPADVMAEALTKMAEQQPVVSLGGSWQVEGSTYQIKIQDPSGKELEAEGTADDERMRVMVPIMPGKKVTLVFHRA